MSIENRSYYKGYNEGDLNPKCTRPDLQCAVDVKYRGIREDYESIKNLHGEKLLYKESQRVKILKRNVIKSLNEINILEKRRLLCSNCPFHEVVDRKI